MLLASAAWGLAAAGAQAQSPTPTPTPPPAESAPPAATAVELRLKGELRVQGRSYLLTGDRVRAVGRMQPAAAGERVIVRFSQGGKVRRERRVRVGDDGAFAAKWRAHRAGGVRVVALHQRSDAFERARDSARLKVLRASLGSGSRGPLVRLYQRKLARLGYAVSRSGRWDDATGRATMAYRKVNGMARTYSASRTIVRRVLDGKGAFKPRHRREGRYVEADLSRQVLALIEDGKVFRVYHTSSGSPATPTVLGTYRVYMKTAGTNSLGMVHSSYFVRGYAIHGYASVPPYNASHGCLRVPIPNALFIYNWARMGTPVTVYP